MSKPAKAKRRPKRAKTPEALDAELQRALQRAAETCQQRFDEHPTRQAYHLAAILKALEADPHLIDPVYKKVQAIQETRAAASGEAVVTAIAGVPVRRLARTKDGQPVINKDGDPVWQRIQGRAWEGPRMVNRTRWAIAAYDAEPLDVAAAVMNGFPPLLKADCPNWTEMDADQVGLAIAADLGYGTLRSALIANRQAAHEQIALREDTDSERIRAAEQCDQANKDLLDRDWKATPAKVLRAILRELGHPAPDNLTRD